MDQMMALRSRLDGTNWVIVIDEAQHLKYAALEEIRSLTDDNPMTGEHGVGVVLIGNSEVYSRLQGRQQAQFAQLFSRIRMQREYTARANDVCYENLYRMAAHMGIGMLGAV